MSFPTVYYITRLILPATRPGMQCACVSVSEPVYIGVLLSAYTHATQTTVHASQSQQPPHPHRVPRQLLIQTKDEHMTIDTTQTYRPKKK